MATEAEFMSAARQQGLSDGRYGYPADPGDWPGRFRTAYLESHEQGRRDREAEPHRFSTTAPACTTVVDGCVVHGDKPLTDEGRAAVSALIGAARQRLSQEP